MVTKTFSRADLFTDVALHPGEFVDEEMVSRGLTPAALAEAMNIAPEVLQGVLAGGRRMPGPLALGLESALGIAAHLWMDMQSEYDLARARIARAGA